MMPRIIGSHPLAKDANGRLLSRIGTIFPYTRTLITLPGIHATQRLAYLDTLDEERIRKGQLPLSEQERAAEWANAVDLIMEDNTILIRPDPDNMALAFQADEILTQFSSTRQVRFLYARNEKVHEAVKRRGECWRITPLPKSTDEMIRMICSSRIGIGGRQIYYYNNSTGTRFLTCHEFSRLAEWPESERRQMLYEIQQHSARTNRFGNPEVAFFLADKSFSKRDFAACDFLDADKAQLEAAYAVLREKFFCSVPMGLRQDDVSFVEWRNRMFVKLIAERDEMVPEETFLGLSSEFFMQIEWLPGGRCEHGEFILDPIFGNRSDRQPRDPLCDDKVLGFIFNFIREYGDLEYVNVGRVVESLSRSRILRGRRDVFLAEIKPCDSQQEIVKVIRMQKYGVAERLNEGKDLLQAMLDTEEYTDYVLDRRLACRQLGMNILPRLVAGKLEEIYAGTCAECRGRTIWSPFFERDYIRGVATDKVPNHRYKNDAFALRLARLLGLAAAPNMIVGRRDLNGPVVFDDGDEVLIEDQTGLPTEILVVDQMGTFTDYTSELASFAVDYARPVRKRLSLVSRPAEFAAAYLQAFCAQFCKIQQDYRSRQRAFDNLFAHRTWNEAGSLAYRWNRILKRLDETNPQALTELIRQQIDAP
ncbi:MAG: hypothetical protein NTY19_49600 [Planctomycetota bacterium]|nr:hypothetical protein [Planctomycetota bacterium]